MGIGKPGGRHAALLATSLVAVGSAERAVASPEQARVAVLESYAGARPADAEPILKPLWLEFDRLGYLLPRQLAPTINNRVARPASTGAEAIARGIELADGGYAHWIEGEFEATVEHLSRAVTTFHQNPVAFAEDPRRRDILMKALVGLALARGRLGESEASAGAMSELVRSFPDRPPDRATYGPEALSLYRRVKKELTSLRPGSLQVQASDESVAIYVNERFAGLGAVVEHNLPPGAYRVYAHKGGTPGRLRTVEVSPGVVAQLDIDWHLDASVHTSSDYVGLVFQDPESREAHEAQTAVALARATDSTGVVVVGIRNYRGRRSIVGTRLSLDSARPIRTAAVALEPSPPSRDTIRSLARFLAGGEPGPGLILASPPPTQQDLPKRGRHDQRSNAWRWLALGTGAATLAGGVMLIRMDGPIFDDSGNYTPDRYDTKNAGIALTVAGAALVGTGVVLWLLGSRTKHNVRVAAVPTHNRGWAFALGGAF